MRHFLFSIILLSAGCSVAFETRYPWDKRPGSVAVQEPQKLPTPPSAATPTPTPSPTPEGL